MVSRLQFSWKMLNLYADTIYLHKARILDVCQGATQHRGKEHGFWTQTCVSVLSSTLSSCGTMEMSLNLLRLSLPVGKVTVNTVSLRCPLA